MLLVSHRADAKHVHLLPAGKGEAPLMRKATRHGYNQCQTYMQCLIYTAMLAHNASPVLTPSKPPYIFLTPCRTTVSANDVHSRHARQTPKVQLPAHHSPLMFSLNANPFIFLTTSDNTYSVQVRGAKHCPEPCTSATHCVQLHVTQVRHLEDTSFNGYIWSQVKRRF